jgi:hypothetical protein
MAAFTAEADLGAPARPDGRDRPNCRDCPDRHGRAASGRSAGTGSWPVGIVLGAFAIARVGYWAAGLRFDVGFAGSAMQIADLDLLERTPVATSWYLHVQPPLFNLFVGLGARLFGPWAGLGFQAAYLGATVAMLVAFVRLCLDLGVGRRISTVLGVLLAISPTVAQYEHLLFYTHLEAVLLVLAARSLQRWSVHRARWGLVGFSAALSALALGRSLYHPLWFLALFGLLFVVAVRSEARRALAVAIAVPLLCGLAVGTKNAAVFGWWTTSSLEGINLHRITEPYLTDRERQQLEADGAITWVSTDAFSCQAAPGRFAPSGPSSPVGVLDRRVRRADPSVANLNDRDRLACLHQLRTESLRVLVRAPDAYGRGVARAVPLAFTSAVPDPRVRAGNQAALDRPGRVEALLLGAVRRGPGPLEGSYGTFDPGIVAWLLVVAAVAVPISLVRQLRQRRRTGDPCRDAPVLAFILFVVLTGVVLTQLTEVGENNRLLFVTWPLLLAGSGLLLTRCVAHVTRATR